MRREEESLDPEDWEEFRQLARQMVDDMLAYQQTLRERPVWQPVPPVVARKFEAPLPLKGQKEDEVYREFRDRILPFPLGNLHPRFWGWVMGNGTPLAAMSEMLASVMNPNVVGFNQVAPLVEWQVINWCKEMFGYPKRASGILVTGGSAANLTGLAVARAAKAGYDVRTKGVGASPQRMVMYGSAEMHFSLPRAADFLGLGSESLRRIPVDAAYRIDLNELRKAIEADLKAGLKPICLIGVAGSTNTGSVDPLKDLADIASEYRLWFHVDAAFGAWAYLVKRLRPLLAGMERADSLAFDFHKWGYLPFEVGCVLVRNSRAHLRAFSRGSVGYLQHEVRGVAGGPTQGIAQYGMQGSRGFRALKVWMALKTYGVDKIARMVEQNVAQAAYLETLIRSSADLELVAPVALNVVCFRFRKRGLSEAQLRRINHEIVVRLQESGTAVLSGTDMGGSYAMRCSITNHRSQRGDFELLVAEVRRLGKEILASTRRAGG